jgi:dipeptide transport system substrate-binding protein
MGYTKLTMIAGAPASAKPGSGLHGGISRTMNRFGKTLFLAAAACCLLSAQAVTAKTLVYCSEGSPENFYPAINTTGTSFDASARPIYNRLVEFETGTANIRPGLAESWEVSPDGTIVTFHLRRHVKFQKTRWFTPSRELTAADVVFSFERQWKPDNLWYRVTSDNHSFFSDMGFPALLKSVTAPDDFTVVFELNRPEAPFLADLAMDFASILSKEYADRMMQAGTPEKLDQFPVGTGPFYLVQYQKDSLIRFKAHPNYWEGKAAIDDLIYAITPDSAVRLQKLKAGECHVIPYPNPAELDTIRQDPALELLSQPGLNIAYLAFQTRIKPFDDKRVRQAINKAINKQAILDAVYAGVGIAAKNPIPPVLWSYDDEIEDYPYDPEGAKALLAEAGFPKDFKTELWAMPVQRPYNPNARRMAELIQADLARIGITAEIKSFEWGEYRKRLQQGEQQMALFGWTGDNGDPDNFLHVMLGCAGAKIGGSNVAKWCFKPFDDLVTTAEHVMDREERAALYRKAQVIFKEEAPWVPIAHSNQFGAIRKEVTGFKLSPFGSHIFYGVDVGAE